MWKPLSSGKYRHQHHKSTGTNIKTKIKQKLWRRMGRENGILFGNKKEWRCAKRYGWTLKTCYLKYGEVCWGDGGSEWPHLYEMSTTWQFIETGSRSVVDWGWRGLERNRSESESRGYGISFGFGGDENVFTSECDDVWMYPKSLSCTLWVNCLVCKLYINKAFKKFLKDWANILRYLWNSGNAGKCSKIV